MSFLKNNPVDQIISDIKMPVMDGIALAKWIYEQKRMEKIIFISGYKDFDYARKAMEYGVSYYCLKPVTYPEIKQKLANIRQMLEQEKYKGQPEKPKEELLSNRSRFERLKNILS